MYQLTTNYLLRFSRPRDAALNRCLSRGSGLQKSRRVSCAATLLLLVFITNAVLAQEKRPGASPGVPQNQALLLSSALQEMGTDYDRFFTIEEAVTGDGTNPRLSNRSVVRLGKRFGLIRELEETRRTVPGFTYYVSRREPRVIHVIEAALEGQKNYGMSAIVPQINFTGTIMALTNAIGMQGIPVAPALVHNSDDFPFLDFHTEVKVSARRLSVREVLTDFIPLRGRGSRIIWFAKTKVGQKQNTFVEFRG